MMCVQTLNINEVGPVLCHVEDPSLEKSMTDSSTNTDATVDSGDELMHEDDELTHEEVSDNAHPSAEFHASLVQNETLQMD